MALIKCPECGKEVSDKANSCPHCGYPLIKINKEVKRQIEKPANDKTVIISNIILGIFGILMLLGVLRSDGGIEGNVNAAIVSTLIILGAVIAINLPKRKSLILTIGAGIAYLFAMVMCVQSLSMAPAYLILEMCIVINIFILIRFAKKSKIY